jgi:hypothetical protein
VSSPRGKILFSVCYPLAMTPRGEQRLTLALWAAGWVLLTLALVFALPPAGPVILTASAGFGCLCLGGLKPLALLLWHGLADAINAGASTGGNR